LGPAALRALDALGEAQVVLWDGPGAALPPEFTAAAGDRLAPFFSGDLALAALGRAGFALKNAEFLILAGEDPAGALQCLDQLYPRVNFLTLVTPEANGDLFRRRAGEIFAETGLTVFVTSQPRACGQADVIFPVGAPPGRYDAHYKRGALYIEPDANRRDAFRQKRGDVLAPGLGGLEVGRARLSPAELDAVLLLASRAYRTFARRGFAPGLAAEIRRKLQGYRPKVLVGWG
jgi:hypothetical protein